MSKDFCVFDRPLSLNLVHFGDGLEKAAIKIDYPTMQKNLIAPCRENGENYILLADFLQIVPIVWQNIAQFSLEFEGSFFSKINYFLNVQFPIRSMGTICK